jgi:uncharacterized protein YyaL (SSP411 family)
MSTTIKLSTEADRERIRRLAELDSKPAPDGDVLAEVNGRLVAAMGMDGRVVADPFERTASVVRVLRAQVDGEPPRAPRRRRWLSRLVAAC